jgi:redox-sensitive bicupin YhaK (pirin superfamily)
MGPPRYQEVAADSIPAQDKAGVKARVVAGRFDGVVGPVTEIAAQPVHGRDPPAGDGVLRPIPAGHTAIAYIFEGSGQSAWMPAAGASRSKR